MRRLVILLILVLLIAGGVYFYTTRKSSGKESSNKTAVSLSPTAGIAKTLQMQVAENYFAAVIACFDNPPNEAEGQTNKYCQFNNAHVGKNLEANMKNQQILVVCAQNLPKKASAIRSTEINADQALVILSEDFALGKVDVTYQMQRENGVWKVENILCPKF